jgi:hypothetical protein
MNSTESNDSKARGDDYLVKPTSRRAMLRDAAALAGSAFLAQLFPASLVGAASPFYAQQASAPATDPVAAFRAQMAAAPIEAQSSRAI